MGGTALQYNCSSMVLKSSVTISDAEALYLDTRMISGLFQMLGVKIKFLSDFIRAFH